MIIHRVNEGEKLKFGLNWLSNENTFFSLKLVFPIWPVLPSYYVDFDTENNYYGWQVWVFYSRIRIRRWKNFSSAIRKVLYGYHLELQSTRNKKLISTRKMLEDGKWQ